MYKEKISIDKVSSILDSINQAIFQLLEFYPRDELVVVMPRHFKELITAINRDKCSFLDERFKFETIYGLEIFDGYEDAIVVYNPEDFYLKKERIKRIELNLLKN